MKGSPEAQDPAVPKAEPADQSRPSPTGGHRGWNVRRSTGSAKRFHDVDPDPATGHEIWIHRLDRPAVIFGSTQVPGGLGDGQGAAEAHMADSPVEVCSRRSGGGLVIARPDDVWIDAIVPRRSPLHSDDVGLAFRWLGQIWLEALDPLITDAGLDSGDLRLAEPPPGRRASDRTFFCFADIGYGEVLHRDRKVVGISQRRTRNWTRLQSLLVTSWNPAEIDDLVDIALTVVGHPRPERADLGRPPLDAEGVAAGFEVGDAPLAIRPATIVQVLLGCLPVIEHGDRPDRSVNPLS